MNPQEPRGAPRRARIHMHIKCSAETCLIDSPDSCHGDRILKLPVSQRTNEIGIRRALGAPNGAVLRDVLYRGVVLIGIGLILGLVASLGLTRLIRSFLWGITATDPPTFCGGFLPYGLDWVASVLCARPKSAEGRPGDCASRGLAHWWVLFTVDVLTMVY